ncbi:MAG: AMP-binding protein, partial [Pirellulales bacterium]
MTRELDASTLLHLFTARVAQDAERPALWTKRDGVFRAQTWNALAHDVRRTAAALAAVGVRPGDRVVQVSENRPEWIVTDLAIQWAGAIHVPVHAPLVGLQIVEQILDCGARVVVLSGPGQAEKLVSLRSRLPKDMVLLSYDACPPTSGVRPLSQLAEQAGASSGRKLNEPSPAFGQPDDIATIIYTSGTTGEPKGVTLSQRNLTSNTLGSLRAFEVQSHDIRLTLLPLSHIFARTCDLYGWIAAGCQLALAENRETVLADCALVKPTLLNGVPYFFDKVMRLLVEEKRHNEPGSLREKLGGRVRFCCSGGAALPDHVARFFNERDVPLVQGYGLTETSPVVTLSTPEANKVGFVGRPVEGVEVRVAPDGEILTRGSHVMIGYWQKPEATAAVLRDGWFYTGDLGEIDADGFVRIT